MKDTSAIRETIYRLDGPLRQVLGEPETLVRHALVHPGCRLLDLGAGPVTCPSPSPAPQAHRGSSIA